MTQRSSSPALWLGLLAAATLASSPGAAREASRRNALPAVVTLLHGSILRCWNVPPNVGPVHGAVQFRLALRRDGSLAGEPVLVNPKDDAGFMILAESARRAITRCAPYAGLKQHAKTYESWRDVVLNFHRPDL